MKSMSRLVLGLATITLLASCGAKTITADEAVKISQGWSAVSVADTGYTKVVTEVNGEKNEVTGAIAVSTVAATIVTTNKAVVSAAASSSDVVFKSNGKDLELSYSDKDGKAEYKINDYGLTTWSKVTDADGKVTETKITWSK